MPDIRADMPKHETLQSVPSKRTIITVIPATIRNSGDNDRVYAERE